jgi:hypothetical protein
MGNVRNCGSYINVPSSQTYVTYEETGEKDKEPHRNT